MGNVSENVGSPSARSALPFFAVYGVTAISLWFVQLGGWYTLVTPLAMTFVAVPAFDVLLGVEARNPPGNLAPNKLALFLFRLATWIAVPAQAGLLLWGIGFVTRASVSATELAGITMAIGITGGVIGITVAHELVHRRSRLDVTFGGILLTMVSYLHWAIEHVAGHHRHVATPLDPATARRGESLVPFIGRSVLGGFISAWKIESARNARRGVDSPLRNRVLWCVLASVALAATLGLAFGPRAVWFFLGQSAVAVGFLETINYIEHYGLERRQVAPGTYERVTPLHSWNSAHRLTNLLLFNLQRHSDHHVWPARAYYSLRHHPESPQLPLGYAGMALLAMVPPLWRRVMHPRLDAFAARLSRPDAPATAETAASR